MEDRRKASVVAIVVCLIASLILGFPAPANAGSLTSATWTTTTPDVSAPNSVYNYGFTTASTATLGSVRMTVPAGTTGTNRYLDLNNTSGNYSSTPDSTANSITGDIDIRAYVALTNWTPGGRYQDLVSKSNSQKAFHLFVDPSGNLGLQTSADGSTWISAAPTVALPATNGSALWVRATRQMVSGANNVTNYYTSVDGTNWTQLGSTRTVAGNTSIIDTTDALEIGTVIGGTGNKVDGKIYYADVRNAIQGTTSASGCTATAVQVCFNPNDDLPTSTTWTSSSTQQEAWTVNRTATSYPADIASDLTVSANTGISAGTARLRQIDGKIIYTVTTPASVPAATAVTLSIGGIVNSQQRGNQTSTITTYDGTPSSVDSATTGNLLFVNSIVTSNGGCLINAAGTPQCWGDNNYGQVADGTLNSAPSPVSLSGGPYTWSDISDSNLQGCGLNSAGAAYCWGDNWGGAVGDGSTATRLVPTAVSGSHIFANISSRGSVTSCGVTTTGTGYCWGNNGTGEVGDGTTANKTVPTAVSGGLTFSIIDTGAGNSTCGVTTTGAAYCWGTGGNGQIGNGGTSQQNSPTAVSGGLTFTTVSVGTQHACALTPAGAAYCWGINSGGQIGDNTNTQRAIPTLVSGGLTFASITAGTNETCAVTTAGAGYCWGGNNYGSLGDGTSTQRKVPTAISGGYTFEQIATGAYLGCGLTSSGAYYCWGMDDDDKLGSATIPVNSHPLAVSGGLSFATISIGTIHACGVTTTGAGYCWGLNAGSDVGDGTSTPRTTPTLVSGGYTWSMISAGSGTTCGVTTSNVGYCWGSNTVGQVGDGTTTNRNVPAAVSGSLSFSSISAGQNTSCGVTTTNAAYCWGSNSNGQFGDTTTTSSSTPVATSGGLLFSNISVPTIGNTTCGVTTTNVGYCWGYGGQWQIGNGSNASQTAPTAVSGGLAFSYISVGGAGSTAGQTCGVTTTGVGYCWGISYDGQTGFGNQTTQSTPHAITGGLTFGTSTGSISAGNWNSCGVTSTNIAYCWGYNGSGRLGDGSTNDRVSPMAVVGGLSFSSISAGQWGTCGITPTNAAYCWGSNMYDTLGNGTATTASMTPEFLDNAPTQSGITQTKTTSSVISAGGWTNETSVVFGATLTDQDTEVSDTVKLCVEVEPVGTSFTYTGSCSSLGASGSTVTYSATGLSDGTQYRWIYRTGDLSGGYSQWIAFNSGSTAFGVDTTTPTTGSVALTTTSSLSAVTGTISGFSDTSTGTPSGIATYSYALGTTSGGTDVVGWTSNGASTSVSISSLSLRTTQPYYLSVTATDNASNVSSVVTSPVKLIVDSSTFTSTQPSVAYVNSGNTASVSFTVTTSTNAYNGYQIYATMPSALTYQSSTISNFSGGTWASPNALSAGTGAGYTSSDASVSGSNRFQAATCPGGLPKTGSGCVAAFSSTSPGDVIADNAGPVTGTAISNETFTITLNVSVPSNQGAGRYLSQIQLNPIYTY